ncbi:uncharacterized protein LOC132942518 [Metopolophium dirhodum]|uniref:uncharacterized protein LOC132942518 n=1 Tax=Metopolophium dirhodum TaxID=44670 RepID=UPI0029902877|nr:uncharacterized protein LOC132942518 [Metopolophium dirhodum]
MAAGIMQSIDDKVDEDFLFFLEHYNGAFNSLRSQSDKEICSKWIDKLTIETYKTTNEKQIRNIYLSQLILNMNSRKLSAPFNDPPKPDKLSLDGVFKEITAKPSLEAQKEKEIDDNKRKWSQFVRNREIEIIDLNHLSNDGRTYIACKTLPENAGLFAYVAVTMGDTTCGWVNTCGQPIPAPQVKPLDLKVDMSNVQNNECKKETRMYQLTAEIKSILLKRKAPEIRILTYEFFKKVYGSIEQEMLSEENPSNTACRDPYVEKLLEKLIIESKGCENFDPHEFKKIKMLSTLKKRVKNILRDIEKRNNELYEIEVASTSALLTLTSPASTCTNSVSEMMWERALAEKPTNEVTNGLYKTYPACLVQVFLSILVRERQRIVLRLMEKQENLIVAMRRDLQTEIKCGIQYYKVARREWMDVMRVIIHYNKIKASLTEKDNGCNSKIKGDYLDDAIRKEINDTRRRLEKLNGKNEKLQDDICELNKTLHEMMEKIDMEQLQTDDLLRDFQNEINSEKNLITERAQTIDQLGGMLQARQKCTL